MQTKTSTRHPDVQHTTIYSTTTIQSPTHKTSPRDILSNLNYPVQETTTTERGSTTPVKKQPRITMTKVATEPLRYTLSSLIHPAKTITPTTTRTTATTKEMDLNASQQTTTVVKKQPRITMTTVATEPLRHTLSSLEKEAKGTPTTVKTAKTTIHSRREDFGQLTLADKPNQEEIFLPSESLSGISHDEGTTVISDSTNSPLEDKTLTLENTQAYLKDVQSGNKIAFDNVTNIASDVANISVLESLDKSTPQAIIETLKELQCLNSGQAKIRNKTNLDSDIDIQVMCNEHILQNETGNLNRSNITATNEVVQGQNYVALSLVIVGFVVMVLNGLVITVCTDSNLRKNVYLFLIFGLAFNDFVLGCVTCIGGLRLLYIWINNIWICIIVTVLASSCLLISLYQSLLISLHRFMILSNNECSEIYFKNKRKYFVCFTGWVVLIASVSAFVSPVSAANGLCYHGVVFGGRLYEARMFYTAISISFIIATLVFYCLAMYSLRARYLQMSSTFLKYSNTDNKDRSNNKKIIDSMKLVTILLVALYTFSGPFAILNMVDLDREKYKNLYFLAFSFAVLNSLINPIVYYFKISEFEKTLKRMFCNKQDEESIETNGTQNKGISQNGEK